MRASTGAFDYSSPGFVCQNSDGNVNAMVPAQHSPRYWHSGLLRNIPSGAAWQCDGCGRITCDLIEGVAVNDPYVSSIADLNDTPRRQSAKCSAHSRKRGTDVLADVRAVHRQINFGRLLALGDLELFDELQEHRELSDGSFLAKQKSVPLGLPQFLTELANNVKFQLGVFGKTVAQRGDRKTIRADGCYGLGRVCVPPFLGQPEYVVRKQECNDMFPAIACFFICCDNSRVDVEDRGGGVAFTVNNLALLKPNNRRHNGEPSAFLIAQQLVHAPG